MQDQIDFEFSIDIKQLEEMEGGEDLWLTERQAEFWKLHANHTLTECAEIMDIQYSTAENHRENIYRKRTRAKNTLAWMDWIQGKNDQESKKELQRKLDYLLDMYIHDVAHEARYLFARNQKIENEENPAEVAYQNITEKMDKQSVEERLEKRMKMRDSDSNGGDDARDSL